MARRMISYTLGIAVLAALLLAVYAWLHPARGVLVLEYHHIADRVDDGDPLSERYFVPSADFAAQLDYLQAEGYETITMLEFSKAAKGKGTLPEKPLIVTFDDGYEDNYTVALPLLEERGMKGEVYVVTNFIGTKGYLTWDELRDMQQRGIEIGCHTADHVPLVGLSRAEQEDQVRLSKLLMEWNGIKTVFSFSYPNGSCNAEIAELLRESNYLTAVTGDAGFNTFQTDPMLLQRLNIPRPRFGLAEFRLRLLKAKLFSIFGINQHLER